MPILDTLRKEYEEIGPKVVVADAEILAALAVKQEAAAALEDAKAAVRDLKKVRDPLRVEQMQLANAIGNVDPDVPGPITISNGGE
jgi:hypothetical protein